MFKCLVMPSRGLEAVTEGSSSVNNKSNHYEKIRS